MRVAEIVKKAMEWLEDGKDAERAVEWLRAWRQRHEELRNDFALAKTMAIAKRWPAFKAAQAEDKCVRLCPRCDGSGWYGPALMGKLQGLTRQQARYRGNGACADCDGAGFFNPKDGSRQKGWGQPIA